MTKREFLAASLGVAATAWSRARAADNVRVRKAKTTKQFKAPEGFPNAISVTPEFNMARNASSGTPARGMTSIKFSPATQPAWFQITR